MVVAHLNSKSIKKLFDFFADKIRQLAFEPNNSSAAQQVIHFKHSATTIELFSLTLFIYLSF